MRILPVHPLPSEESTSTNGHAVAPPAPRSNVTVGLKSRLRTGAFRNGPAGRRGANAPLPHSGDAAHSPADDDIDPDVEAILYDIH